MANLKIFNLNNKSNQYLFKNKLSSERKSKSKLIRESLLMFFLSILIFTLILLIPKKEILIQSFLSNIQNVYINIKEFLFYFYQVFLVIFIIFLISTCLLFLVGSLVRLARVFKVKNKRNNYH